MNQGVQRRETFAFVGLPYGAVASAGACLHAKTETHRLFALGRDVPPSCGVWAQLGNWVSVSGPLFMRPGRTLDSDQSEIRTSPCKPTPPFSISFRLTRLEGDDGESASFQKQGRSGRPQHWRAILASGCVAGSVVCRVCLRGLLRKRRNGGSGLGRGEALLGLENHPSETMPKPGSFDKDR